jgi:hypothetical protein
MGAATCRYPLSVVLCSGDYGLGKYGRVSDPKFFTNGSWFPAMEHRHRDRVPAGIYES